MGLFDKMFGGGAATAQRAPNSDRRFNELKGKYGDALRAVEQQGVQLQNLHVQDNKLYMKGFAPSEAAKNAVWAAIKAANPAYDDVTADITVREAAAPASPAAAPERRYTVKSGDTLSKISKEFYGDANEYMRIFYANRQIISDPDKIKVGQDLVIPADTDD